jgi:hypothetical protein
VTICNFFKINTLRPTIFLLILVYVYLIYPILLFADEIKKFDEFIILENHNVKKDFCNESIIFNGNDHYCLRLKKITLNSCGKQSDWPCLNDEGCLEIEELVKQ